ncbi:MAG: ATP-binding protein [Alphaproteobacteria bacterium]
MTGQPRFLPRHLVTELQEALATARVVNLIGPRQTGKTTLVRDLFSGGKYITLDDQTTLDAIEADPDAHLANLTADLNGHPLIIDEAQRSKSLALAIKARVDAHPRKGQFVLTGSSNVFTTADVTDSLAGRMQTIKLWPLTTAEAKRRPLSRLLDWAIDPEPALETLGDPEPLERADYIDLFLAGGFPETRDLPHRARQRLYRDYMDAVVDRDVADVLKIRKTDKLRILIDQMAVRTGAEVNVSELSGLLGIKRETVDQYLDVLMRLSLIIKLSAWTSGESRRDIKNAKFHMVDTGITCALRRMNTATFDVDNDPAALGGLVESFVFNEILRMLPFQDTDMRLYHWRSADRREIDILVEAGRHLVCIEVKASTMVRKSDFKHLDWFAKTGPGKGARFTGIVFYLGLQKARFGPGLFALPVSMLWSNGDTA